MLEIFIFTPVRAYACKTVCFYIFISALIQPETQPYINTYLSNWGLFIKEKSNIKTLRHKTSYVSWVTNGDSRDSDKTRGDR